MHACVDHKPCIDEVLFTANLIFEGNGLRFASLRKKIPTVASDSHSRAKANDRLGSVRLSGAAAGPPTVYRTLDFLLVNSLIHKLTGISVYVGCPDLRNQNDCYFLICSYRSEIKKCCDSVLKKSISDHLGYSKFEADQITLEIEGEFRDCKMKRIKHGP